MCTSCLVFSHVPRARIFTDSAVSKMIGPRQTAHLHLILTYGLFFRFRCPLFFWSYRFWPKPSGSVRWVCVSSSSVSGTSDWRFFDVTVYLIPQSNLIEMCVDSAGINPTWLLVQVSMTFVAVQILPMCHNLRKVISHTVISGRRNCQSRLIKV